MSALVEFLLARIAEDEAVARYTLDNHPPFRHAIEDGYLREDYHDPARVLAECEAKRRIVEIHQDWPVLIQTEPTLEPADPEDLAQPYADHPDFDPAWRLG